MGVENTNLMPGGLCKTQGKRDLKSWIQNCSVARACALENKPNVPFRRRPGIKLIKVNPKTGLLSKPNNDNYILEAFKPGQMPNRTTEFNIIDFVKDKNVVKSLSPLY